MDAAEPTVGQTNVSLSHSFRMVLFQKIGAILVHDVRVDSSI